MRFAWALYTFVTIFSTVPGYCQSAVDARNTYERLLCIVPVHGAGKGTADDPKRPLYAPKPADMEAARGAGIIGFAQVLSDDGKFMLVEYVARDREAFREILDDKTVKAFLKGRDSRAAVEAEFKKMKKDFDFTTFGVRLP